MGQSKIQRIEIRNLTLWLTVVCGLLAGQHAAALDTSGLPAALQAVIANNPAIKGKQAEVDASGFSLDSAKAGRYPTVSGQANTLDDRSGQATLRVQQPLWAFGKIDTEISLTEAEFTTEQLALLQVQRELLAQTAVAYARIEGVRKRLAVAKSNITEHERLYQQIQRREKGMLASETDVRLAYSRLLQARSVQQRLEGELRVAAADLQVLTLTPIAADQDIDPTLTRLPPASEVIRQALANSAALKQKQARLASVSLSVEKEKVAPLPTLYLRAEQDWGDSSDSTDDSRVGLVLEANLDGLGFVSAGRVKGAAARLRAAQQDIDVIRNEVRHQIERLLLNKKIQVSLLITQQETVAAIEGTAASFLRQYESGRKSWLDVLNTQRELAELTTQLEQIRNEELILTMRIQATLGNLDDMAGIRIP